MKNTKRVSEKELEQYFAGELSSEQSIEIKKYLLQELILKQQRYQALQSSKKAAQGAVENKEDKPKTKVVPLFARFNRAMAASAALVIVGIWHIVQPPSPPLPPPKQNSDEVGTGSTSSGSSVKPPDTAASAPVIVVTKPVPTKTAPTLKLAPPKVQLPDDVVTAPDAKKGSGYGIKPLDIVTGAPVIVVTNPVPIKTAPTLKTTPHKVQLPAYGVVSLPDAKKDITGSLMSNSNDPLAPQKAAARQYIDTVLLQSAFLDTLQGSDALKILRKQFNEQLDLFKKGTQVFQYSDWNDLAAVAVTYEDKFAVALCQAKELQERKAAVRLLQELLQTKDLSEAQRESISNLLKALDFLIKN
ncbi:MAG: hypothetical protein RLZZ628_4180 [Bacteroidota bacterium]